MQKGWLWLGAGMAGVAVVRRAQRPNLLRYYADRGCVITGAGSGFGREMVRRLVALEARVLAVDIDAERLSDLRAELPSVQTLQADLTDPQAPEQILAAARAHLGRINLLHNNAGIAVAGPFTENTPEQIAALIAVNLTAQLQLTRHILPHLLTWGGGDIVFTASLAAWLAAPSLGVYSATKAGIKQFAYALRRELAGTGVNIACLYPNVVRTQLLPDATFDVVPMRYGVSETIEALLCGVAQGQHDIFVNGEDRLLQRVEQLAPRLIDRIMARRRDVQQVLQQGVVDGRER